MMLHKINDFYRRSFSSVSLYVLCFYLRLCVLVCVCCVCGLKLMMMYSSSQWEPLIMSVEITLKERPVAGIEDENRQPPAGSLL